MKKISEAGAALAQSAGQSVLTCLINSIEDFFPALRQKRFDNLLRVSEKATEILKQRKIPLEQRRELAAKVGLIYIPTAAVEDDPTLQDMLAGLLSNALDPNFDSSKIKVAFVDVIKSMDPLDAQILKICHENPCAAEQSYSISAFISRLNVDEQRFRIALENLKRLFIVQTVRSNPMLDMNGSFPLVEDPRSFSLTAFGNAFLEACF